jgi:hypothetical protein
MAESRVGRWPFRYGFALPIPAARHRPPRSHRLGLAHDLERRIGRAIARCLRVIACEPMKSSSSRDSDVPAASRSPSTATILWVSRLLALRRPVTEGGKRARSSIVR